MSMNRRQFTVALSAGVATLIAPTRLLAQPGQILRVIVGYAPGGAADNVARAVGEGLREGYTVLVENKAGAAGRLAPEALIAAPADGNTLLMTPLGNFTINPHIHRSLRYDPLKDFVAVAGASSMSFGFAVGADSPAKTFQEFLALAKKDPSLESYGTPGAGTAMHFIGVMLAREAKLTLTHIPYRGGSAALTDVIGGTLPSVITTLPNLLPMHRAGKIRILAISNSEPISALPGVPTFKAAGFPDLTMSEVFGFFARSGTPARVVAQLNAAISAAVKNPKVTAVLEKVEFDPYIATPEALDKRLRTDYAKWAIVVKATGYKSEE